jgi:hypothetical protein
VGGVPRHVLVDDHRPYLQAVARRNHMVRSLSLVILTTLLTSPSDLRVEDGTEEDANSAVICSTVTSEAPDYETPLVQFVSEEAASLVRKEWAGALLHTTGIQDAHPSMAAWAGLAFLDVAVDVLAAGGQFKVVPLTTPKSARPAPVTISLSRAAKSQLLRLENLVGVPVSLEVFEEKNQAALDCVGPGPVGYQMTISGHHDLNCDALRLFADGVGATPDSPATVYIVVPSGAFHAWQVGEAPALPPDLETRLWLFVLAIANPAPTTVRA